MDPTIPRHRSGGAPPLTYGWFISGKSSTLLRDWQGNTWPVKEVSIAQGSWGFDREGIEKLPRPTLTDASGKTIQEGDRVLIDFFMGDPTRPVVRGCVRSLSATDFLAVNQDSSGANPNRLRVRVAPIDSQGTETGDVRLKVADSDAGTVELLATDSFTIQIGPDLDGAVFLTVAVDGTKVSISKAGLDVPVLKATPLASVLAASLAELAAAATALGLPTVTTLGTLVPGLTAGTYDSTTLTTE